MKTTHFYAKIFLLGLSSFYSLPGLCSRSLVEEGAPQPSGHGLPVQGEPACTGCKDHYIHYSWLRQSLLCFDNNTVVRSARNFPDGKFLPGSCASQQLPR